MQTIQQRKQAADFFINKVKGALMYRGGAFEGKDFSEMTAKDFIYSCFQNCITLDCNIEKKKEYPWQ
jgi:hypothetical protein